MEEEDIATRSPRPHKEGDSHGGDQREATITREETLTP